MEECCLGCLSVVTGCWVVLVVVDFEVASPSLCKGFDSFLWASFRSCQMGTMDGEDVVVGCDSKSIS